MILAIREYADWAVDLTCRLPALPGNQAKLGLALEKVLRTLSI